jgi:hypothetical protein
MTKYRTLQGCRDVARRVSTATKAGAFAERGDCFAGFLIDEHAFTKIFVTLREIRNLFPRPVVPNPAAKAGFGTIPVTAITRPDKRM